MIPETSVAELLERYDGLLLDAYGVLVDAAGALPGAIDLVAHLEARAIPYMVVSNDASRLPSSSSARFRSLGLPIPEEKILTPGALLGPYFAARGIANPTSIVLGTQDSFRLVRQTGCVPLSFDSPGAGEADAVILCDETGFPFLEAMDHVLSMAYRRFDAEEDLHLLLVNPDLVFPKGAAQYGFAAGSMALVFDAALALRYPAHPERRFVRLGKPHAGIFEEAMRLLSVPRLVMIGDQLETDVRGARQAGLDAALVSDGLTLIDGLELPEVIRPNWLLSRLWP